MRAEIDLEAARFPDLQNLIGEFLVTLSREG
jgi:hypothetical protein